MTGFSKLYFKRKLNNFTELILNENGALKPKFSFIVFEFEIELAICCTRHRSSFYKCDALCHFPRNKLSSNKWCVFLSPGGCSHSSVLISLDLTSRLITTSLWKLFWLTRITGAFKEESGSPVEKQTIICKVRPSPVSFLAPSSFLGDNALKRTWKRTKGTGKCTKMPSLFYFLKGQFKCRF